MRLFCVALFSSVVLVATSSTSVSGNSTEKPPTSQPIFGFRDSAAQTATEARFLVVPDPKLAEEHLRTLTQAPTWRARRRTKHRRLRRAEIPRRRLDTEIVEYKVWINYPSEISVDATAPAGVEMHGPPRARRRRSVSG